MCIRDRRKTMQLFSSFPSLLHVPPFLFLFSFFIPSLPSLSVSLTAKRIWGAGKASGVTDFKFFFCHYLFSKICPFVPFTGWDGCTLPLNPPVVMCVIFEDTTEHAISRHYSCVLPTSLPFVVANPPVMFLTVCMLPMSASQCYTLCTVWLHD